MDSSKFRGPSPEGQVSSSSCRIDERDLKKIKVKIIRNISNPDPNKQVDRNLENPEELAIFRGKGEGKTPIFNRKDIVVNNDTKDIGIAIETNITQHPKSPINPKKYQDTRSDYYSKSSRSKESSRRSPRRENRSSPRESGSRHQESGRENRSRHRESETRHRASRSSYRESPRRYSDRYTSPRRHSRMRSRSRESLRRSRHRSLSRSSRRSEDWKRRHDHREYDCRSSRERRISPRSRRRSCSPNPPRHSHFRPPTIPDPLNPNALGTFPLLVPPELFYGPEDLWLHTPIRQPLMLPRGFLPPRGLYRPPLYRPHLPRPPFIPMHPRGSMPQFRGPMLRPRIPRE